MPLLWGHRRAAFIPRPRRSVSSLVLPRPPGQWRYGFPSASSRRLPLSPFLGFVIRPIGLTVPIRLIPHILPYPYLSATLSPAYLGLILHLWILILRATHHSQQGVVPPSGVPTQLVAVCRASPAGRCRATFRRLPLSPFLGFVIRLIGLTVPIRLIPHILPYPYLSATLSPAYLGLILHLWILIL